MILELELEPQVIEALTQDAAELGVSVEQLAVDIIRQPVEAREARRAAFRKAMVESMSENRELLFRLTTEYVLAKNAEVYRRLAKSDTGQTK